MTDVWDFERDLYPFNLERARDEFDAFWPANNLVSATTSTCRRSRITANRRSALR